MEPRITVKHWTDKQVSNSSLNRSMGDTTASFRPPKPSSLGENETIRSFASWQSNMLYHLSLNNDFARFLQTLQKCLLQTRALLLMLTKLLMYGLGRPPCRSPFSWTTCSDLSHSLHRHYFVTIFFATRLAWIGSGNAFGNTIPSRKTFSIQQLGLYHLPPDKPGCTT